MKKLILFLLIACGASIISNKTFAQANNGNIAVTDTMVIKVGAYVIQPNDKLADLLSKVVTIKVDREGKIYAQGEPVERIFVDGEEFYSDSPAIAARMLRADKIELLKIYWRMADQASFTGIDNKVRQKVINVILKK